MTGYAINIFEILLLLFIFLFIVYNLWLYYRLARDKEQIEQLLQILKEQKKTQAKKK